MHRPNRVGVHTTIDPRIAPVELNGAVSHNSNVTLSPKCFSSVPVQQVGQLRCYGIETITAGQRLGVAIPVTRVLDTPGVGTTFNFSGHAFVQAGDMSEAQFFVGECDNGTISTVVNTADPNPISNPFMLPSCHEFNNIDNSNYHGYTWINQTVDLGPWISGTLQTRPLLFGFDMYNRTASNSGISFDISMCVFRWQTDLQTVGSEI
ncbi:hypothetical protein [Eel River basin pequenovirus]|nr:hypothetical protein [Eel River basin pequenovirus]